MSDLLSQLLSLDDSEDSRDRYIRAPLRYPGNKFRSLDHILPELPYRRAYIEPCGGTGAVLLNRQPSKLEVFNDRCSGITVFFRCLRDQEKCEALIDRLNMTVHSREEFIWCRDTWEHDVMDDVERAARWYYMMSKSFNHKGKHFARTTNGRASFGSTMKSKLNTFRPILNRICNVILENMDWRGIIKDYNKDDDQVWYFDPPYYNIPSFIYSNSWTKEDHLELVERIHRDIHGFVALSGYDSIDHPYNKYKWTKKISWEVDEHTLGLAFTETNNLKGHENSFKRGKVKETLWILDR